MTITTLDKGPFKRELVRKILEFIPEANFATGNKSLGTPIPVTFQDDCFAVLSPASPNTRRSVFFFSTGEYSYAEVYAYINLEYPANYYSDVPIQIKIRVKNADCNLGKIQALATFLQDKLPKGPANQVIPIIIVADYDSEFRDDAPGRDQ